MKFQLILRWFAYGSLRVISAAELNFELKFQANDIRISLNWKYNAILPPIDIIWSNKMEYNLFLFCLDDADTKNKKMNANTGKLKGTLKIQK
jgi:hypothetical protein